jgi:similar to stage IV sporulation protein
LSLEKFMNRMTQNAIRVTSAKRTAYATLYVTLSNGDYRKLCRLEEIPRISVVKEHGWALGRKRLRYMILLLLAVLASAALIVFNSFIWTIEAEGDPVLPYEELIEQLHAMGVGTGMRSAEIDLLDVETKLMLDNPQLLWVDVRINGVKLNVELKQRDMPPELLDGEPCNIVAQKEAVIDSLQVLNGKAVVEEGDAVKAGDILISGILQSEGTELRMRDARGEVYGRVVYTQKASAPIYEQVRTPTGRTVKLQQLLVGNWVIDAQPLPDEFEHYDVVRSEYYLSDSYLPIKVAAYEYSEVMVERIRRDIELVKEEANDIAYQKAVAQLPKDAVIKKVDTAYEIDDKNVLHTVLTITCVEQIGSKQPL